MPHSYPSQVSAQRNFERVLRSEVKKEKGPSRETTLSVRGVLITAHQTRAPPHIGKPSTLSARARSSGCTLDQFSRCCCSYRTGGWPPKISGLCVGLWEVENTLSRDFRPFWPSFLLIKHEPLGVVRPANSSFELYSL